MSLSAAFNIGRSALTAGQIGLQVAGNNMANASTPGYSRQVARLVPIRGNNTISGFGVGSGVAVSSVQRQVDAAVEARLRAATAENSYAQTQSSILSQIEDALGELGENDLSSQMSSFFTAWSERATGDASVNRRIRNRLMYPVEIPVLGAAAVLVLVVSVSRVFLAVSKTGSSVTAIVVAALILALGFAIAYRPRIGKDAIAALLVVLAGLVIAGGIISAAAGSREFEHHEEESSQLAPEAGEGGG